MSYISEHRRGIIGSGIVHLIILALLILMGFMPQAIQEEEGILVNFGNSENGFGVVEPAPNNNMPSLQEKEQTPPPAIKTTPPKAKIKAPEKEEIMTQDYEKTVAIKAAEKKRKDEEEKIRKENAEKERKRLAEIEKQKQEELEKQRLAKLEQKRVAEENRKIDQINSRTKGAFNRSESANAGNGNGPGGAGTGTNPNQGVTFPGGNQGVPTGDPNATTYGPGGRGAGKQGSGTGISYSLSGRTGSFPPPNYPGNEDGKVVVQIKVDKSGKVIEAIPGMKNTTIMNQEFWKAAQEAAFKAKFNEVKSGEAFQVGTITYKFSLK
jgi:colicin import membrane protein